MSDVIVCPSGMSGLIRGLTGKSMRLLSDKQAQRAGLMMDKILDDCWQETEDPGPYESSMRHVKVEDKVVQKPDWSKVLIGDRIYTLLQIRSKSFGPVFSFKVQCPNTSCRARFDYDLNLDEMTVKSLSAEDRTAFADGNRLLGALPDGRQFWFRLLTGADEAKLARANADYLSATKSRIYEIEGLSDQGKNQYFDDGDISNTYDVIAEMDRRDCGVDTDIESECPDCQEAIDIKIPFDRLLRNPKKA